VSVAIVTGIGERAPAGDPAAGVGGGGGLLRLPEDRLAPLHLREDELGAGQPGTIEHQIDRRSPPAAQNDRGFVDGFGALWPGVLEAVAVHTGGGRPRFPCFEQQPALEREPQQVRQFAVGLGVPRDDEHSRNAPISPAHAAAA
jgi:hypothetical protein